MGVQALQAYLENCCPSAIPIQSIQELAERCRDSTDQKLTIVVDGLNITEYIYRLRGYIPSIGGGQFKQFSSLIQLFVRSFNEIGIRLVFFFDGTTVAKKRSTWVERRIAKMENYFHLLDMLKDGAPSDSLGPFFTFPGIFRQTKFILEEICNCEVFQSDFECDEEIADYVRREGAFGVLGHDSDFVIFDIGRALYIDSNYLDLNTMKTRIYYPEVLAQSLGLNKSHLPLLATLMGNDFVRRYELKQFHNKLTPKRDVKYLVPKIATYIKSLGADVHDYRRVAKYVFGSFIRARDIERSVLSYITLEPSEDGKSQAKQINEHGKCITEGKHYDSRNSRELCQLEGKDEESEGNWRSGNSKRKDKGKIEETAKLRTTPRENMPTKNIKDDEDEKWFQLVRVARQLLCNNTMPDKIYGIMKHQLYESCCPMEDFRIIPRDLPIFAELTLSMRQRFYGILLKEKPSRTGSHSVEEWCNAGLESLESAVHVPAVVPSVHHPGLLALWGEEDRPEGRLSDIRWTLFVQSISPNLDVQRVRQLPPHLVLPTLILHYIVNYKGPGRLEDWEVEVFLATATVMHHYEAKDLHHLPDHPTLRGIRVSNIVMLTGNLFYDLLAACGSPLSKMQTAIWNYFDGKLFQFKYGEAEKSGVSYDQLCDNKYDSLEAFQQAWSVIFDEPKERKKLESG